MKLYFNLNQIALPDKHKRDFSKHVYYTRDLGEPDNCRIAAVYAEKGFFEYMKERKNFRVVTYERLP